MTSRALATCGGPARLALHTAQAALFDPADALPPGLAFAPDFVSPDAERALLALAAALPLREARYKTYTARRRVFAYGIQADEAADGAPNGDIIAAAANTEQRGGGDDRIRARPAAIDSLPPALQALRAQLAAWAGVAADAFVHVMVAEYQRGTPLGWHRDAPQHELIAGVSLGSPARLRFRPWPAQGAGQDDVIAIELAPRSAYVMRDTARWGWQHSVPPVPGLRYSVTMRTARR